MAEKEVKTEKVKKSFGKKLLKAMLILILLFTFFSISLIILSQFRFFRNFALSKVLYFVNNELVANVEIDDLTFMSLHGLKLEGVRLITAGDTLANIPELTLSINYEALLDQKVSVNRLVLKNPTIRLLRNAKDSIWNYDLIAFPSTDTTVSKPVWMIKADHLEFQNANFTMYDSTSNYINYSTMDYSHIQLDSFNLILSADVKLKNNDFAAHIRKFQAKETYSGLKIKDFAVHLKLTPEIISLSNLEADINESSFDISVDMKNYNVFDTINPPDIAKAEFILAAKGYKINDAMIQKFAVIPISFGTESDIKIDAEGTLSRMKVSRLKLETGQSDINIAGELKNLLETDKLEYELSLDNSEVTRADIIKTLRSMDLSGIPEFGTAKTERLYVKGYLDSVYTDMDIETSIGSMKGKGGVNYGSKQVRYFGDFIVENVNLKPILRNEEFTSNLNGRVFVKGSGTDLENLNADFGTELKESQIYGMKIRSLISNIKSQNKIINIDTLDLTLMNTQPDYRQMGGDLEDQRINAKGTLDITNMQMPVYNLKMKLSAVNFSEILKNNTMPDYFTANVDVNMKGLKPDSLIGEFSSRIAGMGFKDRTFLPFEIKGEINELENGNKSISVNSDFFKVSLIGKYKFSDIIQSLSFQGNFLARYIQTEMQTFNPKNLIKEDSLSKTILFENMTAFPTIDAEFTAEINDLSPLNIFLDSINLYSDINMNLRLISEGEISTVFIDSISIDHLDFKKQDLKIKTNRLFLDGRLIISLENSFAKIENFELNLDTTSSILINETEINNLFTVISYDGSNLNYVLRTQVNNDWELMSGGNLGIGNSELLFNADSVRVVYKNLFAWHTTKPIIINSTPSSINIRQFEMQRDSAEIIHLSGSLEDDFAKDIFLDVRNLPVPDFMALTTEKNRKQYAGMRFTVDSLRVRVNGDLKAPKIVSSVFADSMVVNNFKIGTLNGRFIHNNTYIHGYMDIITPILDNRKTLVVDINYLPIYLGTDSKKERFDGNKDIDIRLKSTGLPLELVSPFAVGVKDLSGLADANIVVEGKLNEGIVYSGSASSKNARFKVENTNVAYNADFKIDFNKDKITLTKINLKNIPQDIRFGRIGSANVSGFIELTGFDVGNLDISVKADRLLVMSDATIVKMPDLYGDFIISTGSSPLRFHGTLDRPNLDGDVNIIYGHLKMPLEQKRKAVKTYFTYKYIGNNKVRLTSITKTDSTANADSTQQNEEKPAGSNGSIADRINYDLTAKIQGQFIVEMDMNFIGSMYAVLGTPDYNSTLRYVKTRESEEAKLYGEVVVKDQSTIKSLKQFNARGKINFTTGSIENPNLDLTATYTGTMIENSSRKQFVVTMTIKGNKDNPKVSFDYTIDGVPASGSEDQITQDALYLITVGRTKGGEGSATGPALNNSLIEESVSSGVSNFATQALSQLLMTTGVINSAEFEFQNGSMDLQEAKLKLSGQLYGGISWTIGGTVADLSSNNQITIDIPASEFSNNPFWSNFVLQLSKASSNNLVINSQDAKNWEVKVKLGSSW